MKVIEITDNAYKVLEEIADEWNKRTMEILKEDPDLHLVPDWDPGSVLYTITMMEYKILKEENENNISKNE